MTSVGSNASRSEDRTSGCSTVTMACRFVCISLVACYGLFLYHPEAFRQQDALQPLVWFFDAVDTYSPFHEFLKASEDEDAVALLSTPSPRPEARLFTVEELKQHDGSDPQKGIYLSLLGQVFDVSKGADYYGPGGGYSFFSAKDASRAFVSGDFSAEGLVDDIRGLSAQDYIGLADWVQFYQKDYTFVGYLVGRFYDDKGAPTEHLQHFHTMLSESVDLKEKASAEKKIFPPCNSEWSAAKGQRVWCTERSGGILRDWVGVPRKLFLPGQQERCVCVKNSGSSLYSPSQDSHDRGDLDNSYLREYDGCESTWSSCQISKPSENEGPVKDHA